MTDSRSRPTHEEKPAAIDAPMYPSLADDDEPQESRGRIGYGKYERRSSWLLAAVLLLVVGAIGINSLMENAGNGDDLGGLGIGKPAPDFAMQTFSGDTFRLSDARGKVVIVNFWGSWCEPCKREMPALQAAHEQYGESVVFVGVGAKRDPVDKAEAFAAEYGVTYAIGRDTEGGSRAFGGITEAYNVAVYPSTFVIDPEGNISSIAFKELTAGDLDAYIKKAEGD